MFSALSIVALGFLLGMRHATDADHVVAVATIVSGERRLGPAAWIGALWGVGHTLTIATVGTAIILFNWAIPARLGLLMELSVGVMLVLLGAWNLSRASGMQTLSLAGIARPFVVGVVHGLAGSAAVALLVLATIHDPRWAIAYLLVFGAGTVAGMMLITTIIATPFAYSSRAIEGRHRARLQVATAALSLAFGLFLVYKIGYVDGLFGAQPQWIPE